MLALSNFKANVVNFEAFIHNIDGPLVHQFCIALIVAYNGSDLRSLYTLTPSSGVVATGLEIQGPRSHGGEGSGTANANVPMTALPKSSTPRQHYSSARSSSEPVASVLQRFLFTSLVFTCDPSLNKYVFKSFFRSSSSAYFWLLLLVSRRVLMFGPFCHVLLFVVFLGYPASLHHIFGCDSRDLCSSGSVLCRFAETPFGEIVQGGGTTVSGRVLSKEGKRTDVVADYHQTRLDERK